MTSTEPANRAAVGMEGPRLSRSSTWLGFAATVENQVKAFYREPAAVAFTLGQPFILLLILNAFDFQVTLPNGETRPYLDRLLPGMIAFNGMTVGFTSVAFALSRYKERGVLRRIRATPLPTWTFLTAVIASRLVTAFAVTLITYLAGVYAFGAKLTGSVALLFGLAMLGAAAFIAIGLLVVSFAKSEDDIPPMFMLVLMPSVLFSGAFLDRSGLPDWLHWVTNGLPLTFLTDAAQRVANGGATIGELQTDILGLLIWGAAASALCSWKFRMA